MQDYNNQPNEYGTNPHEHALYTELNTYADSQSSIENPTSSEFSNPRVSGAGKAAGVSKLISTLVLATAAVTVGVSTIPSLKLEFTPPPANVQVLEISADDDSIEYSLNVSSDLPLQIRLHNNFTDRNALLEDGENSGSFEDLRSNRKYQLSVVRTGTYSDEVLFRQTISTLESEPEPIPQPASVELTEYAITDNTVSFKVTVENTSGLVATLSNNNEAYTKEIADGEQELIFENLTYGAEYTFTVTGEREFVSQVISIAPLDIAPTANLVSHEVVAQKASFTLDITSDKPLKAILYNEAENYSKDISSGRITVEFDNLNLDTAYTFAVVNESELLTQVITTPHPFDLTTAQILSHKVNEASAEFVIKTEGPQGLKAVLSDGTQSVTKPLVSGENTVVFDSLQLDTEYTLTVLGDSADGEKALITQSFKTPHPLDLATVELTSESADKNAVYLTVNTESDVELKAVFYNETERYEEPLINGENSLDFRGWQPFTDYTFAVIGQDDKSEREIFTHTIKTPHPLHMSTVEVLEYGMADVSVFAFFNIDSPVPLEAILYNGDEIYRQQIGSLGEQEVIFDISDTTVQYTLAIVGEGPSGEEEIFSTQVYPPHPIDYAYAAVEGEEFLPLDSGGANLILTVLTETEVPLQAVLYNANESYRQDLTQGENTVIFENLPHGETYTFAVVGEGYHGEVEIYSQEITIAF